MDHPLLVSYLRWIVLLPLLRSRYQWCFWGEDPGALWEEWNQHRCLRGCWPCLYPCATCLLSARQRSARRTLSARYAPALDTHRFSSGRYCFRCRSTIRHDDPDRYRHWRLIHLYSIGYMHDDEAYWRFFAYPQSFYRGDVDLGAGR